MTYWPPFSRQRNKASGQSLRLQWRTFAAEYNGGAFTKTVIDRNDVRGYRYNSFVTFSTSRTKWQSRLYNERVYRLHRY